MKFVDYQKIKELDPHTQIILDSPTHGTRTIWASDLALALFQMLSPSDTGIAQLEESSKKLTESVGQLESKVDTEVQTLKNDISSTKTELTNEINGVDSGLRGMISSTKEEIVSGPIKQLSDTVTQNKAYQDQYNTEIQQHFKNIEDRLK